MNTDREHLEKLLQNAFEAGQEYERQSEPAIVGESLGKDGDVDFYQWLAEHEKDVENITPDVEFPVNTLAGHKSV